jgi:hypothetical protein
MLTDSELKKQLEELIKEGEVKIKNSDGPEKVLGFTKESILYFIREIKAKEKIKKLQEFKKNLGFETDDLEELKNTLGEIFDIDKYS